MKDTEYLTKKVEATSKNTPSTKPASDTEYLRQRVVVDTTDRSEGILRAKMHKRMLAAKQAQDEKVDDGEKDDEEKDEKKEQSNLPDRLRVISDAVTPTVQKAGEVTDRIAALPTTGGIALLVVLLVLLLFTVVQVNPQGDTRLKQLWYMLNGRATIQGRQVPNTTIVGGGAVGTFGNTATQQQQVPLQPLNSFRSSSTALGF